MFKKAIFTKSADCVLQLTKGIVMECKVCQQQNRIAVDLSKKAEPLIRTIVPMDMNTHIMSHVLITHITQTPIPLHVVWAFVVIAPYWEERG